MCAVTLLTGPNPNVSKPKCVHVQTFLTSLSASMRPICASICFIFFWSSPSGTLGRSPHLGEGKHKYQ